MPDQAPNRFDVFLSYHWRDHAQVEALAHRLREQKLTVFLDRWYLTPGQSWPKELETTLARCRAVAVCIGQGEMGPGNSGSSIWRWSGRSPLSVRARGFPSSRLTARRGTTTGVSESKYLGRFSGSC